MLAHRVVPQLLCRGRQLLKGVAYDAWRSVGTVTDAVKLNQYREVDEMLLLDIGATPEGRGPDLELISELADMFFSPLTVGGGINTVNDVRALLRAGADKVCIGTAAMVPGFVSELADRFGSSTIVVSIDARRTPDGWRVYTHCGKHKHLLDPAVYARNLEAAGAGEILLNSVDFEGKMDGYDLELIVNVSHPLYIPVIASGGCGIYHDMAEAIYAGADAVAAGAMFQFSEATPAGAAKYLMFEGLEARCN